MEENNSVSLMFQSTPPREGRQKLSKVKAGEIKFQSMLSREGRRVARREIAATACFNPRPHVRGDLSAIGFIGE